MSADQINSLLFSVHIGLFGAYIYTLTFLFRYLALSKTGNGKKRMLVFSNLTLIIFIATCAIFELYFLYAFYVDIDLYIYEYINILQQIIFIYLFVNLKRKEE